MKKILLSTLALTLLCGCASLDSEYSEPGMQGMTELSAATVVTTSAATDTTYTGNTGTAPADSNIWLERGVYEIQETEEQNPDLAYDNRFKGEFYVFSDESHGEYWCVYDGKMASFTCEQKKDSISFRETNLWNNSGALVGSKWDFAYSHGSDHDFETNEAGDLVFRSYGRFMFSLIKRPDLDPDDFDATAFKSEYVLSEHGWLESGSYAYKGKKLDESAT